jgi:PAS domain S-box-containing protein
VYCISNCRLPDCPIVYASDAFLKLTGYTRDEVVGKNCRFLQGPETDMGEVRAIGNACRSFGSCDVHLLNYKKNGEKFWNFLHMEPINGADGSAAFFVGVQCDVTDCVEAALEEGGVSSVAEWSLVMAQTMKVLAGSMGGFGVLDVSFSGTCYGLPSTTVCPQLSALNYYCLPSTTVRPELLSALSCLP